MKLLSLISLLACLHFPLFAQIGDDPDLFYSLGLDLQKEKKYAEAIQQFEKAILYDPENHLYYFQKGNCHVLLRQREEAIESYEKAIEMKDDFFPAYTRLAKLYTQKKEHDKAIHAYEQAFDHELKDEKKVKYKLNIIRMLQKLERFEEADKHIADLKSLNTNNLDALFYEAHYANTVSKEYEVARHAMEKATKQLKGKKPEEIAKYYYQLGIAYHNLGFYSARDGAFDKANYGKYIPLIRQMSPSYYHKIAVSFMNIYEFELTREYVSTSFEMQKKYPPALKTTQTLELLEEDKQLIISHIEEGLATEKNANTKLDKIKELVEMQINQGMYQEARTHLVEYLAVRPTDLKMLFFKAIAEHKMEQNQLAIKTLENSLKTLKMDTETKAKFNFALGWYYKQSKLKAQAQAAFKRAATGSFQYAAKSQYGSL